MDLIRGSEQLQVREPLTISVGERQRSIPKQDVETRLTGDQLERVFRNDELVWSIVNKYVSVLLPDYMIEGEEPNRTTIENFCKRTRLRLRLFEVVRDIFVHGTGFMELVPNIAGNNIVKLVPIDAKTMDLQRENTKQEVIINLETKEPIGFLQEVYTIEGLEQIKIAYERISYFKFFSLSGSWLGFSPIEALYKTALVRKNLEDSSGEIAARRGDPVWIAEVGDAENEPTPQEIRDINTQLQQIGRKSAIAVPYNVKIRKISGESMDHLQELQDYYTDMITRGFLIPAGITGGQAVRGTYGSLEQQAIEWERTVEGFQEMLSAQIEDQVFYRYLNMRGLDIDNIPVITWKTESSTLKLTFARMLSTLARVNLIKPTKELDNFLREKYGLPLLPDDYVYVTEEKKPTEVNEDDVKEAVKRALEDQNQGE
jgi:hypothetical protein